MPDVSDPRVSVIIPVYRNPPTLRALHTRLSRLFNAQNLSYELVFVNDACPEDSLSTLIALAQSDSHTAVLALEYNVGQQRAVITGLAFARGEHVVVMDADLQDPPEAICLLLGRLEQGYATVFAGRQGAYESATRLFTSRLFKRLLSWLSGVPPNAGIFCALNREMVERLLAFDAPRPFLVAMIGCTGMPFAMVPVERAPRPVGTSAYNSWKRLKTGVSAIGWTLVWRLRRDGKDTTRRAAVARVRSYYGARFASTMETQEIYATV